VVHNHNLWSLHTVNPGKVQLQPFILLKALGIIDGTLNGTEHTFCDVRLILSRQGAIALCIIGKKPFRAIGVVGVSIQATIKEVLDIAYTTGSGPGIRKRCWRAVKFLSAWISIVCKEGADSVTAVFASPAPCSTSWMDGLLISFSSSYSSV
jgi:hypothetical protein